MNYREDSGDGEGEESFHSSIIEMNSSLNSSEDSEDKTVFEQEAASSTPVAGGEPVDLPAVLSGPSTLLLLVESPWIYLLFLAAPSHLLLVESPPIYVLFRAVPSILLF